MTIEVQFYKHFYFENTY